jgi:hypothetical protein
MRKKKDKEQKGNPDKSSDEDSSGLRRAFSLINQILPMASIILSITLFLIGQSRIAAPNVRLAAKPKVTSVESCPDNSQFRLAGEVTIKNLGTVLTQTLSVEAKPSSGDETVNSKIFLYCHCLSGS